MIAKRAIVSELGEEHILLPELIAQALCANDQVKYYFALLQSALAGAQAPHVPPLDLRAERLASHLTDVWLDDVIAGTRKERGDSYRVPHGAEILQRIAAAVRTMLACLPEAERHALGARVEKLRLPDVEEDLIAGGLVSAMTSGSRAKGDSLHLVVMDAHKAINRLQAETAVETLAGARVHRLTQAGRAQVEAFMGGLNRTAPLKFDHPGLSTTAAEHNGRLVIQNDIGTTDAHVLVLRIEGLAATLTYTDIHAARLKFFKSLFAGFAVDWQTTQARRSDTLASEQYMLATGRYVAPDEADLARYLAHLGSRIVYLIDWNKMRKRLRLFVSKEQAVAVLRWAADNDYGHRALLEIGGEKALAEAIEFAAASRLRYGQRLDDLVSEKRAVAFLQDAIKAASLGLRQRRSRRAINDEIKARLRTTFESERLGFFSIAARHAAIAYDLALATVEAIVRRGGEATGGMRSYAQRAAQWESRADGLLNEARDDIKRFERPQALLAFIERCDDCVDQLEEAAALIELAEVAQIAPDRVGEVRELAELALASTQEIVKSIECAASVSRADIRDDLDEFMGTLERLVLIEHQADDALRAFRRRLIGGNPEQRQLIVLHELSKALEAATDAPMAAAQALRVYLMEEVIA
ncbi:MAG: hypothetical protein NW223_07915 [Hyphomicrobiaceae bacterium]|nr:hypothetical protein [Hyphomicrobiaceae bacterium]